MNYKIILTFIAILILNNIVTGQIQQKDSCKCNTMDSLVDKFDSKGNEIFYAIDQKPEFEGGDSKLFEFVQNKKMITDNFINGKVFIAFTINCRGELCDFSYRNKTGNIRDIDIIKIIDHLKLMPKWTPGEYKGVKVDTPFTIPINIKNGYL